MPTREVSLLSSRRCRSCVERPQLSACLHVNVAPGKRYLQTFCMPETTGLAYAPVLYLARSIKVDNALRHHFRFVWQGTGFRFAVNEKERI